MTLELPPPHPLNPSLIQIAPFLSLSLAPGQSLSSVLHKFYDTSVQFYGHLNRFFLIKQRILLNSASYTNADVGAFECRSVPIKLTRCVKKGCGKSYHSDIIDLLWPPAYGSGFSTSGLGHLPQHKPVEPSLTLPPCRPIHDHHLPSG